MNTLKNEIKDSKNPKKKKTLKKKLKKEIKSKTEILEDCKKKKIKMIGIKNLLLKEKRENLIKEIRKKTKTQLKEITKKDSKTFLVIDMSKQKPGFCILTEEGEIKRIFSFPGSSKNKRFELLLLIEDLINEFNFSYVIFESTFTKFKKSASVLSVYQGLVSSCFVKHNIEMFQVSNLIIKNYFGCTEKEELFKSVTSLYSIDTLDFKEYNDEIDALAIGLVYLIRGKSILKNF